jgi:hypothetical protein
MIATKREQNLNYFAWQIVETEDSSFTPCVPLESTFQIHEGFDESADWPLAPPRGTSLADEDILADRVRRFESVEEMLTSLK